MEAVVAPELSSADGKFKKKLTRDLVVVAVSEKRLIVAGLSVSDARAEVQDLGQLFLAGAQRHATMARRINQLECSENARRSSGKESNGADVFARPC